MYDHLEKEQILPPEQKGGRRGCRGTKDQLMIDKMIPQELQKETDQSCCMLDRLQKGLRYGSTFVDQAMGGVVLSCR